ncbi:MAG: polysaccharide deacetylase family protein [Candidatus Binatia bacterium]|nr:polysaccharide deacetylase family protein [Candidatus Binatia bacterium]
MPTQGPAHEAAPKVSPASFLFSVDLEDVRSLLPDGSKYAERVPANADGYLRFLEKHGVRATFFTVGDVARRYPDLIARLVDAGHELACHTSDHTPLERLGPDGFRADLERNVADLHKAGAGEIRGFRAPIFSLTDKTAWAYEALRELGFTYSSSVLPHANPLYGWEGFGTACVRMESGVWEVPLTVWRKLAFAGGVYFRVLPAAFVRYLIRRRLSAGGPVVGYFHPYDLDTEQERFMHPELGGNPALNALMYVNRSRVLSRLDAVVDLGAGIVRFDTYVDEILDRKARDA